MRLKAHIAYGLAILLCTCATANGAQGPLIKVEFVCANPVAVAVALPDAKQRFNASATLHKEASKLCPLGYDLLGEAASADGNQLRLSFRCHKDASKASVPSC
jgi:hypothetical protein